MYSVDLPYPEVNVKDKNPQYIDLILSQKFEIILTDEAPSFIIKYRKIKGKLSQICR